MSEVMGKALGLFLYVYLLEYLKFHMLVVTMHNAYRSEIVCNFSGSQRKQKKYYKKYYNTGGIGKLDWSVCICITQLYDGRYMYRIYYIKNNYMFRHFILPIFRLRNEKILVSSYTRLMWVVYSGEVRGEVGTGSRMCYVGWVVWVHGFCYCMLF